MLPLTKLGEKTPLPFSYCLRQQAVKIFSFKTPISPEKVNANEMDSADYIIPGNKMPSELKTVYSWTQRTKFLITPWKHYKSTFLLRGNLNIQPAIISI